jgi:hypothetical protein
MKTLSTTLKVLTCSVFIMALSSLAQAQTRTWVSGVGDDLNPCSRTAPCKTFAGAISKTADKGEIDCIDPGGFGTVTITKNITIDGGGTFASVLAAGTNGININDGATATPNTIRVHLRNLSINGASTGFDGIRFIAGRSLFVEGCVIFNFRGNSTNSDGMEVNPSTAGVTFNVNVKDSIFKDNTGDGVRLNTATATINASFSNVSLSRNANGLDVIGGTANISNSVIDANTTNGMVVSNGAFINANDNLITSNGTGILNSSSNVRIGNNSIYRNTAGLTNNGTMQSFKDNKVIGNNTDVNGANAIVNVSVTNSQ